MVVMGIKKNLPGLITVISCSVLIYGIAIYITESQEILASSVMKLMPQKLQILEVKKFLAPVPIGPPTYAETLANIVSHDKTVLLALVDEAFYSMAINFYLTCLFPYGVTNYLILTMHENTCSHLEEFNINCFFYKNIGSTDQPSKYGTQIFKDKMNVRTDMILDALALGYSVLHTDIDMYYFSNPFKSISCSPDACDIAPLMDASLYNAGFLFIHPSNASINVYQYMKQIAKSSPGTDDQSQLNTAMGRQKGLKIVKLPVDKFQCGVYYYENPRRYFADTMKPCPECVVVHNNWIVSMEAKVYRAKELHQWMYDADQYYSSTTRKYLVYNNTLPAEDSLGALKSALAISSILNRTLILPSFHCKDIPCPLNSFLKITSFDQNFKYREHSFLTHPLVPNSVKFSRSSVYLITSKFIMEKLPEVANATLQRITPNDTSAGMTDQEILTNFKNVKESVLQFHSLYNAFSTFVDSKLNTVWAEKYKNGFKGGGYRQY